MKIKESLQLKKISLLFIIIFQFGVINAETNSRLEILFIGSSYFYYNNLPELFKNLAIESQKEVYIDHYIPSGVYLAQHANSSFIETKINSKEWDFIILQGVGVRTAYPDYFTTDESVLSALELLENKIHSNCESTRIIFSMPWAFEDGMTWLEGWTDTYRDMQMKIYKNTLEYCQSLDLTIAPVGWAWFDVLTEKNFPLHYLHMSDWNHPTLKGSYLMACVIYSTVFVENTLSNPYHSDLGAEAKYFQEIASNIVLNDTIKWNITTYIDSTNLSTTTNFELKKNELSVLYQNYPNPFSKSTTINFEVFKPGFVELNIYNLNGKLIRNLINENKVKGKYSITFNSKDFKNGSYIYTIKINDFIQSKSMVVSK